MGQGKKEEAEALKEQVNKDATHLQELQAKEGELQEEIKKKNDGYTKYNRPKCTNRKR